jgi:predicted dithiol-disulfide oxidoreductase (DUF899 family)
MAKLKTRNGTSEHKVVSRKDWIAARQAFLAKEKEFTHMRDQLNEERRKLPWVKLDKAYTLEGPKGQVTLADLFGGKSQLVVYHFMFGPEWGEGCAHCSFWSDSYEGNAVHLAQRDTAFVAVSRAPYKEIEPFKKRMGWTFNWLSSFGSDFNYDFYASFTEKEVEAGKAFFNFKESNPGVTDREGMSTFYKDENGDIYLTYSTFARGIDLLNTAYNILDLTAKGRDENPENPQDWVDYHDKYVVGP